MITFLRFFSSHHCLITLLVIFSLVLGVTTMVGTCGYVGLISLAKQFYTQIETDELTKNPYCSIPVANRLAPLLENPKIPICPTDLPYLTLARVQNFEQGFMFLLNSKNGLRSDTVYVIYWDGYWESYPVPEGQDVTDSSLMAPPLGRYVPHNEFWQVWSTALRGSDSKLGWAVEPSVNVNNVIVQNIDTGQFMFVYPGIMPYLIGDDGKWYQ